MGDVVNLNRFRKRKAREEASRVAAANRMKHGRTRDERECEAREQERQASHLDQHRLTPGETDD
jgi:hypothetical protein